MLAAFGFFGSLGSSCADSQGAKTPLTKDQFSNLFQHQPVVADRAIFDGDSFPKIDFVNKDLITAALGAYSLTIRFFNASWNEVQKPTAPGRYGAWVEIHFPNGTSDVRHLTLFKTAVPYNPAKDPYHVLVQYPSAFGLSKEVLDREQWNSEDFTNSVIQGDAHQNDSSAVLLAALHDFASDPARWHGFSYWRIEDAWWTGLEKKLGLPQDYKRLVYVPDDYDKKPTDRWPLILFLHGSGERGDDLNKVKDQGPMGYVHHGHALPFIIVTPQCPKREWWSPERLAGLIDQIEASYRIDPKRIYVTGLSMGGYGTFDLAACYPQRFAAIAPLSGGESPEIADRLKTVPTWIFHGADDGVVPTRYSIDIAARMKEEGADVKLTVYPGVGHGGWDKTYADPDLYAWFLQHSRS
jgi:predicted esterase